jgi:hypothetical protein
MRGKDIIGIRGAGAAPPRLDCLARTNSPSSAGLENTVKSPALGFRSVIAGAVVNVVIKVLRAGAPDVMKEFSAIARAAFGTGSAR